MHFKERLEPINALLLGKLIYRNYVNTDEKYYVDEDRIRSGLEAQVVRSAKLTSIFHVHSSAIGALSDDLIVLCTYEVITGHFYVVLRIFYKDGNLLKENLGEPNTHLVAFSAYGDTIVCVVRNNVGVKTLNLYNKELVITKSTNLAYTVSAVAHNESEIHVVSVEQPSFRLYNIDLEALPPRLNVMST